jgi:hypothetical protein
MTASLKRNEGGEGLIHTFWHPPLKMFLGEKLVKRMKQKQKKIGGVFSA